MDDRRDYTPAAYGADYLHNLRWRYRARYGEGSEDRPYRGGGSFGRGYRRATDLGFRGPYAGPWPRRGYAAPYYGRHPRGVRYRRRGPDWRRGTAARDYGYAYPYFGSAALVEASQGYPPADTLNPEVYPPALGWGVGDYGEEYEPPGVVAACASRYRRAIRSRGRAPAGMRRRAERRRRSPGRRPNGPWRGPPPRR